MSGAEMPLFVGVVAGVALIAFVAGTLVGYRDRHRGQEAIFLVRIWLTRFIPALDGFRAVHPFCDGCDAEMFELEAKLDEWDHIAKRVAR